jgi:GDP-L-fucose synthase
MKPADRVFVAGHNGLVGSALVRRLQRDGFTNIITRDRSQLDLTDRRVVDTFFLAERPQYVFVAAAKVGGIMANNTYPADFLRDNLAIALNVIDAAYHADVDKLLFLSSSCVYPKFAPQPMKESDLLTGVLEPTNEPYAIAKIAGMKLCESYHRQYGSRFMSVLPTNLYGPNDNFDLDNSHVLPALIRKFHDAKQNGAREVVVWGSGTPRREFLHVDDLADACVFLMMNYEEPAPLNIGVGEDLPISDLATLIADVVGFQGSVVYDAAKPDGTPRKLLDVSRISTLGWKHSIALRDGIAETYRWYLSQQPASI